MSIPRGTKQAVGLREVADRFGVTFETVKSWWKRGHLLGRATEGSARTRVVIPIEVVEFYLRYFRLPNKLDLYRCGALSRGFLSELSGPDGGLSELEDEAADQGVVASCPVIPSQDVSKSICAP